MSTTSLAEIDVSKVKAFPAALKDDQSVKQRHMSALDEPAGTRSTAAGYNRNDAYYRDATASAKNELRESGPNPNEYLQQGGGRKKPSLSASARKKIAPVFRAAPLVRPKSAPTVVPLTTCRFPPSRRSPPCSRTAALARRSSASCATT